MTAPAIVMQMGRAAAQAAALPRLQIRWTPALVGLGATIVISVSRMHQHYAVIAALRPALLGLLIALGWAFLVPRAFRWRNLSDYWPGRTVMALFAMACLSVAFGISMGNAGKFMLDTAVRTMLQAALVAVVIRTARDLYAMLWSFVIGAGLLSYLSLFVFRTYSYNGVERLAQLYAYDANDAGLMLLISLPLAILLVRAARGSPRVIAAVIVAGICGAIARTGSRGAFLGLAIVGVTMLITFHGVSNGRKLAAFAGIVGALVAFAPAGYWKQMQTVLNPKKDYNWSSTDGRKQLALRGLGYMYAYPVFGIGVGNFQRAECTISVKAKLHVRGTGLRCFAPHNSHIQVAAELGIPGAILWVSLLGGGIFGMRRLSRRLPRSWAKGTREQRLLFHAPAALSLSMLGFAIGSTFLTFAWLEAVYLITAFMIGTYASIDALRARERAAAIAHHAASRGSSDADVVASQHASWSWRTRATTGHRPDVTSVTVECPQTMIPHAVGSGALHHGATGATVA